MEGNKIAGDKAWGLCIFRIAVGITMLVLLLPGSADAATLIEMQSGSLWAPNYTLAPGNVDHMPLVIPPLPTGYINGTVFNNSTGISGATVSINADVMVTANSSGFYSLPMPAGNYNLTVTSEPKFYPNSSINVTVVAGTTLIRDIELLMKLTGNIIGRVVRITQSDTPAPTPASTPAPTQTPAPTPADNGWNLVWSDEFDGTSINTSKWEVYEGETEPYPLGDSCFRPNALTVSGGLAHFAIMRTPTTCYSTDQYGNGSILVSHNYAGAGIGNIFAPSGNVLSEGRWETRARFPNGTGTTAYILLWPADDIWTAEVDFAEAIGSNTSEVTFTQHWNGTSNDKTEEISYSTDVTQFHEYAVEMKNGLLKWYVDDQLIATQTQHFATRMMGFAAGTWVGSCASRWPGCPTGTAMPVYLDMDYVRVYTWS